MLVIDCLIGTKDQSEFSNGGEAHVKPYDELQDISDREWGEYVSFDPIKKVYFMKMGQFHMDVVNGLTVFVIPQLMKF